MVGRQQLRRAPCPARARPQGCGWEWVPGDRSLVTALSPHAEPGTTAGLIPACCGVKGPAEAEGGRCARPARMSLSSRPQESLWAGQPARGTREDLVLRGWHRAASSSLWWNRELFYRIRFGFIS